MLSGYWEMRDLFNFLIKLFELLQLTVKIFVGAPTDMAEAYYYIILHKLKQAGVHHLLFTEKKMGSGSNSTICVA